MLVFERDRRTVGVNYPGKIFPLVEVFAGDVPSVVGNQKVSAVPDNFSNGPAVHINPLGFSIPIIPDFLHHPRRGVDPGIVLLFPRIVIELEGMALILAVHNLGDVTVGIIGNGFSMPCGVSLFHHPAPGIVLKGGEIAECIPDRGQQTVAVAVFDPAIP